VDIYKGNGWMDGWREGFGVSGMGRRISYEFSTQGRGFEK